MVFAVERGALMEAHGSIACAQAASVKRGEAPGDRRLGAGWRSGGPSARAPVAIFAPDQGRIPTLARST